MQQPECLNLNEFLCVDLRTFLLGLYFNLKIGRAGPGIKRAGLGRKTNCWKRAGPVRLFRPVQISGVQYSSDPLIYSRLDGPREELIFGDFWKVGKNWNCSMLDVRVQCVEVRIMKFQTHVIYQIWSKRCLHVRILITVGLRRMIFNMRWILFALHKITTCNHNDLDLVTAALSWRKTVLFSSVVPSTSNKRYQAIPNNNLNKLDSTWECSNNYRHYGLW